MLKRISIFWKLSALFVFVILLATMAYFSLEIVRDLMLGKNRGIPLVFALAIVLGCGSAWFFVAFFINRPIHKLTDGMNRLAEKEFDFRLDEDERGEFGSLASSFNDMASMLSASLTELKKNKDYLESILESSADLIITVNASGNIQTINSGTEKVLGYRRFDVIGKPIEMLFADPHEREIAIEKLNYTDSVKNYETHFLTSEGKIRDVLLTLSRLRNPAGEIIGTIGISKDITEEKRLQNQLIQSQRYAAIGQVFTGIQHSMKNMLNACKGGSYMVRTGLAKDNREMLVEGWEIVQEGISSLTDMSMHMLRYVKEWHPKFERVELEQTLSEIQRLIRQTAKDKGVEVHLTVSPGLSPLLCDAEMIHSAIMDIVSNALDACLLKDYDAGEMPKIFIRANPAHDERVMIIEIEDNGCGMTEEVKSNIFTPFFSTKTRAGTGLGLSITSRMITAHGGKIDVESEPEKGTIFRIMLPLDGIGRNKETDDGKKSIDC